jgi:hypothetical protein
MSVFLWSMLAPGNEEGSRNKRRRRRRRKERIGL